MIYDIDISFLSELFDIIFQFINFFMVLYALLKLLTSCVSKYSDAESERKYKNHKKKLLWKISCEKAYNAIQTPCTFSMKNAIELPSKPLIWSWKYKHTPCKMMISNKTGHVLLEAQYSNSRPYLSGGPLDSKYTLQHIVFKLRPRKDKTITDNKLFVLELQAIHFKNEFLRTNNIEHITPDITEKSPALILNYVYMFSEEDNLIMQQVISRFGMIKEHGSSCYLNRFPLNWILPEFTEYYYIKQDSQPYLSFSHGVQWILSPVRQTLSKQQMNSFTKILNPNYTMKLKKNKKNFDKNEIFFCSEIDEEPK